MWSLHVQGAARPAYYTLRGQGATEYLVITAVVLIIALVSINLLGDFLRTSGDTNAAASQAYWVSARPTGVYNAKTIEAACNGSSRGYSMTLENHEPTPIRLTGISIAGRSSGFCRQKQPSTSEIMLETGEKVVIETPTNISPSAGKLISENISINYTSIYGINNTQRGTAPIVIANDLPPAALMNPCVGLYEPCDAYTPCCEDSFATCCPLPGQMAVCIMDCGSEKPPR